MANIARVIATARVIAIGTLADKSGSIIQIQAPAKLGGGAGVDSIRAAPGHGLRVGDLVEIVASGDR